jgi:anti-sigma B factor antagonist
MPPFWAMTHGPRLCWRLTEDPSDTVVLAASGEMDLATAEELDVALDPFIDTAGEVLLDMRDVTFIDCFGLRAVQRARRRTARLTVRSPSPPVLRLLSFVYPDQTPDWVEIEKADE